MACAEARWRRRPRRLRRGEERTPTGSRHCTGSGATDYSAAVTKASIGGALVVAARPRAAGFDYPVPRPWLLDGTEPETTRRRRAEGLAATAMSRM
ncbi:hypothetical protein ZWY2020_053057 [Hordeum vulgare]|nr:hypothetical protein ZWY2020_053057 [Hordeum vulgare]